MDNYIYILYDSNTEEIMRGSRAEVFQRIGEEAFTAWEDETHGLPKITIERSYSEDANNLIASYVVSYDASDRLSYKQYLVRRVAMSEENRGE